MAWWVAYIADLGAYWGQSYAHIVKDGNSAFTFVSVGSLHVVFLARDSMLSALYAITRPSVRHTGGSVENG